MALRKAVPAFAVLALSAALLCAPDAAAQTAAELERILALPAVSYGDAAWAVLGAAGTALPENSPAGAYRFAADSGWLPKKAAAEESATLGGVSLLIMRAFNIRGGLMYALFPGPRSAYRELAYIRLIQGRAYSTMRVSGERLLRILGRALEYAGDTAALPPVSATGIPPQVREEQERGAAIIHMAADRPATPGRRAEAALPDKGSGRNG
jgi:hypothetical protein